MRRTLRRMILKARPGWEVVTAPTAEKALEELESRCFDVVMTDLRMPGMGGEALLKRLHATHPGTARVIYSAQIETHKQHRASRLALVTLAKPASVEDLIAALDEALESAHDQQRDLKHQAC
jgi:DNA-binding NtrC family response regulator